MSLICIAAEYKASKLSVPVEDLGLSAGLVLYAGSLLTFTCQDGYPANAMGTFSCRMGERITAHQLGPFLVGQKYFVRSVASTGTKE